MERDAFLPVPVRVLLRPVLVVLSQAQEWIRRQEIEAALAGLPCSYSPGLKDFAGFLGLLYFMKTHLSSGFGRCPPSKRATNKLAASLQQSGTCSRLSQSKAVLMGQSVQVCLFQALATCSRLLPP